MVSKYLSPSQTQAIGRLRKRKVKTAEEMFLQAQKA